MKVRSLLTAAVAVLVFGQAGPAQQRPLKVMVLYDMEGVTGASN